MARVIRRNKACAVNPLKMSAPIGAALAFLGIDRSLPLLHGAQGCTAFGLVLFVKHFHEPIPLQTTAMNEVTTILGGLDNLEQALVNVHQRAQPRVVGVITTGLTETKGDDLDGDLALIRARHPELEAMTIVPVRAPDYVGGFESGWGAAVEALVRAVARPMATDPRQVNLLPGSHLTPADLDELRMLAAHFGLEAVIAPDLSDALDGHLPERYLPHTLGGTRLADLERLGAGACTLALGSQTEAAARALRERCGVPFHRLDSVTGLAASDALVGALARISGRPVPPAVRRDRSRLEDALLDAHFHFGRTRIALGAEPDLLAGLAGLLAELGAEIPVAVAPSDAPVLAGLAVPEVIVGDLDDLEAGAAGCEMIITHAHGRQAAARLGIPLHRVGLPVFDRLGAQALASVGYRGTRRLAYDIANTLIAERERHHPAPAGGDRHARAPTHAGH